MKHYISLILCTLGNRPSEISRLVKSLNEQTYKGFELIVVTQENHELVRGILADLEVSFIQIETDKRGLSRARNIGLDNAKGDIITISDDDCWYPKDALEKIVNLFQGPLYTYDAICMQIYDPNNSSYYKTYETNAFDINLYKIGGCSSIEIFFRINDRTRSARFDERFGLGAIYPSSEENIFLADLLKKYCKIIYYPEIIVFHQIRLKTQSSFKLIRMVTAFKMFIRIFGLLKGIVIYYIFYIKHFARIDKKVSSLFPFFVSVR